MSVPSTAIGRQLALASRLARALLVAVIGATSTSAQGPPTSVVAVMPFGDNYYAAADRVMSPFLSK